MRRWSLCLLGSLAACAHQEQSQEDTIPSVAAPSAPSAVATASATASPLASSPAPRTFVDQAPAGTWLLARLPLTGIERVLGTPLDPAIAQCGQRDAKVTEARIALAGPQSFVVEVDGSISAEALDCLLGEKGSEAFPGGARYRKGPAASEGGAPASLVAAFRGMPAQSVGIVIEQGDVRGAAREIDGKLEVRLKPRPGQAARARSWWERTGKSGPMPFALRLEGDELVVSIDVSGKDPVASALAVREKLEAFRMPAGSMLPTLDVGDNFFIDKTNTQGAYADVVAFRDPEHGAAFVKRVVGRGGDTVEMRGPRPVINGWTVPRCLVGPVGTGKDGMTLFVEFLNGSAYGVLVRDPNTEKAQGPWRLAKDELFVIGDNRDASHDARHWFEGRGSGLAVSQLTGTATFVYLDADGGRLLFDIGGPPVMPRALTPPSGALERCLASPPSLADQTPPKPKR